MTENGKLLNLCPDLCILMQKAVTLNTCCTVFGRTVNKKSLVSEILYTLDSQLNCCEVRNEGDDDEGDDDDNNNNNIEFLLNHSYLTLSQHQPIFLTRCLSVHLTSFP